MLHNKDHRSLYDKLMDLSRDPGATPAERSVAASKAEELKRKEGSKRKLSAEERIYYNVVFNHLRNLQVKREDMSPAEKEIFDYMNSHVHEFVNKDQRNAGWYTKSYESPKPRRSRVNPGRMYSMMREAQARAKYNPQTWDTLLKDHPSHLAARQKMIDLMGMSNIERHICIINGKLTKLFLFWIYGISREITWFFIERDTLSGRTKKSKRYFSREDAMAAFHGDVITWKHVEVI